MLVVATIPYMNISVNAELENYEYLILTTSSNDGIKSRFQDLADFHSNSTCKCKTVVKTLDTTNPDVVRNFIINEKNDNNNFKYLLLGGDTDIIPAKIFHLTGTDPLGNPWDYNVATDMYYGCLNEDFDGTDTVYTPELFVGRACVSTETEAGYFVSKTTRYITNCEKELFYLGKILGVGEQHWAAHYGGTDVDYIIEHSNINIDESNGGYNLTKIYEKEDPNWKPSNVADKINEGINFLIHSGHGSCYSTMMGWSNPGNDLSNSYEPFFLYSVACSIGQFNAEDCWAESMGPKSANGAFALVVNSAPACSLWANITAKSFWSKANEGANPIGKALMDAKCAFSNPDDEQMLQMYELNLLGDPLVRLSPPVPYEDKKPTANFTIEPKVVKKGEKVWFNSSNLSFDNDENGYMINDSIWCITFNPSTNGEYDCGETLPGEEGGIGSNGDSDGPIYLYGPDVNYTFDGKGYYDVNLTVVDNEGSIAYRNVTKAVRVNIRVDLLLNYSAQFNPLSSNSWFSSPTILIKYPFLLLNRSPNNPPNSNSSSGSSNQNSSNPNSNPSNPVKISLLLPYGAQTFEENETVEFNVEVENGSGDNYVILDFGDGATYSDYMGWGHTVYHTYTSVGTYSPDIEVHDLQNNHYDHDCDFSLITVCQNQNNPNNY